MGNLILYRWPGESVWIGKQVKVTIIKVEKSSGSVQMAISAPDSIQILRDEIRERYLPRAQLQQQQQDDEIEDNFNQ